MESAIDDSCPSSAAAEDALELDPETLFAAAAADDVDALARSLRVLVPPSAAGAATAATGEASAAAAAAEKEQLREADAAEKEKNNLMDIVDEDGRTLLHVAAAAGRLAAVEFLLRCGISPFSTDEGGWTCLMSAASAGHLPVVEAILRSGGMPQLQQQHRRKKEKGEVERELKGEKEEKEEVGKEMKKKKEGEERREVEQEVKKKQHGSPTEKAAEKNREETHRSSSGLQQLLEMKNPSGTTALALAAAKGHVRVVEALLAAGADINAADNYGRTPLSKAVAASREAAVEFLLDRGADLSTREKFTGDNALHLAVNAEHADICLMLMRKKPELKFQKNKEDLTPFEGGRAAFLKHLALLYEEEGSGDGEEELHKDKGANS